MRQTGVAATEMVIVLVPMVLLVLGMMQICQLAWAALLVRHAATVAARSAMVVLPEGDLDPQFRPSEDPPPPDATPGMLGGAGVSLDVSRAAASWSRSPRYAAIGRAAAIVTAVASPPLARTRDESVASALGGDGAAASGAAGWLGRLANRAAYAALATTTAIVDPADANRYLLSVPPRGEFVVRVTLLLSCRIPLAGRILCRSFDRLPARARREVEAMHRDATGALGDGPFAALFAETRARSEGLP